MFWSPGEERKSDSSNAEIVETPRRFFSAFNVIVCKYINSILRKTERFGGIF